MVERSEKKDEQDSSGPKVGALLQASRQRLGEELTDVASMLRIRLPYLVAIEAGHHQELPGATYAVGFIRAYAEYLGLDSEEVVRRFKLEAIDSGEEDRKLSFPTPVPEIGIPGGAYVFVGLILAILGYGSWYLSTTKDDLFSNLVNPLDEEMITLSPDTEQADPENLKIESETDVTQDDVPTVKVETELATDLNMPSQVAPEVQDESIVLVDDVLSDPSPKLVTSDNEAEPTPISQPNVKKFSTQRIEKVNVKKPKPIFVKPVKAEKVLSVADEPLKAVVKLQPSSKQNPEEVGNSGDTFVALETETKIDSPELSSDLEETATLASTETVKRGSSRIKINAINNSWIQIRDDTSNTMLVTRLLAAGDSFAVPDRLGLVLLTGNAGALEIVVDGTAVPSIGGPGVVRRGVLLEVEKLKAGDAVNN